LEYPKHPGVYAIIHEESGKLYIGSASNIYSRWRGHKSDLRRGLHHSPHLQNAWNKYGEDAFRFVVLESCLKDAVILCAREQHWLDKYRGKLFNAAKHAEPALGHKQSPEMKEASRQRMMGNKHGQGSHYHGVLTERNVVEILHRYAAMETSLDLAKAFGVTQINIIRIVGRRIWAQVEVAPEVDAACRERIEARKRGETNGRALLNWAKVEEIRSRNAAGESQVSLSRVFGVSVSVISGVCTGRTWSKPPAIAVVCPLPPLPQPTPPIPRPLRPSRRKTYVTRPRPEKVAVTCGFCGKKMSRPPCRTMCKVPYCSKTCRSAGLSARYMGRKNPRPVMPPLSGVYAFTHTPSQKSYVGSTNDLATAKTKGFSRLKAAKYHNPYLQSVFDESGAAMIEFRVLEFVTDPHMLVERQQWWLDHLRTADREHGFNVSPTAGSQSGMQHSEATKEKCRQNGLRMMADVQRRQHLSELNRGKTASPETKAKMSAKQQGVMNKSARLGEDDVRAIRKSLEASETISSISRKFGVERGTIRRIRDGDGWNSVK
jgi:group I intron endonuclease